VDTHLRKSDYLVKEVSLAAARALIEEHHYTKGGSTARVFTHGLAHRDDPDTILGVAWWLPPTKAAAVSVDPEHWRGVLALTRLVIVPGMPTNAASYLLGQSIKLIRLDARWTSLVTYADSGQGHTGAIYRATNWEYVGIMPGHTTWKTPEGGQVSRKTTNKTRNHAEMTELGYINAGRSGKHKFVMKLRTQPGVPIQPVAAAA
jgi:hypothetical protein